MSTDLIEAFQFGRGVPPLETIPTRELVAEAVAVAAEQREAVFQYSPLGRYQGDPTLREQLGAFHGVDPSSIFIGNGSLQVLDLLAGHLLDGGNSTVCVEAPTYDRALQLFERHGGHVVGVPVEEDGIDIDQLKARLARQMPRFLYTIPDFQNPSGVTLSESKRHALVELATMHGFTIIEDIPYRELRYHGASPPLLRAIAGKARVITVSSLSKLLSPGLRIGYAISDRTTSMALASLAEGTYLSPAPLCQAIAARCLARGVLQSNIDRVRRILRPRHDGAVAAARKLVGDALIATPQGGYFIGLRLKVAADEVMVLNSAASAGLLLTRGSAFFPSSSRPTVGRLFLRLPFHALDPDEFASALERLVAVITHVNGVYEAQLEIT